MGARHKSSDCSGASALEFALVLPLLMLLVMGAVDWGHYFFVEQVVVNAAREGARAASVQYLDDALAEAEASKVARDYLTRGGVDASTATVTVLLTTDSVRVGVDVSRPSLTGYADLIVPEVARSVAEMRR